MFNYHNKTFFTVGNTENGETSSETIFYYKQEGNMVTADYSGGRIIRGHLIGLVNADGEIDMRYHQINLDNKLMTGRCKSTPELLPTGKIRLHEDWEWTSGERSKGRSIIEEV
ncbi:n-acetylglutamate synthase [Sphingobacterium oryzagri]|uniref:N-acetylglutamate synthase n=1 Tax=Sphingobacterium oryzagri TaxID=3025669 RepID=A0ABY7WC83_9SPHI|nr:n-acetylglutamate synthase [Sphingobacterium sp. KACC 22765]WDF66803.1 n-acetylglutamate synthase [Sphingobacterium sp. KACC 22765]